MTVKTLIIALWASGFAVCSLTAGQQSKKELTIASKKHPYVNSLGMKFVPVPGTHVLFCIHDTRKRDYRKYADESPGVDASWKSVEENGIPVSYEENHPVVMVSWDDAKAFCQWMSKKEGLTYRLPMDEEWSRAVGIEEKEEKKSAARFPETMYIEVENLYPWGGKWPAPKGVGNFADNTYRKTFPHSLSIEGYDDGFATTSPVMSFAPNALGLYDMGGNVYQWCEDYWKDGKELYRVLRGSSWADCYAESFLSSKRGPGKPTSRSNLWGFRIVLQK